MRAFLRLIRRIERFIVGLLVKLPERVLLLLSGARPIRIGSRTLDPQLQFLLKLISYQPRMERVSPVKARLLYNRLASTMGGTPRAVERVEELAIPGPAGALRARLYVPHGAALPAPMLVFFHGGGFVVGDLDDYEVPCRLLADEAKCLVLSAEYRLAPEAQFPAQSDDAEAVWRWANAQAASLGADPQRIAVGGDSAGGHIAAALSQVAESRGAPRPKHQLLIYPSADMTQAWPSLDLYAEGFMLTKPLLEHFMGSVLPAGADVDDPRVTPLRAPSLAGLPSATVVLAGFDPLQDQGQAYAQAMAASQVPVKTLMYERLIHGFVSFPGTVERADKAMREIAAELKLGLAA
ncbi:alpha/beta hydrolase [Oleomonas cavernae]|uniref:Alpha/beta hydrolase n=1 Tax=Oleomonas cavernae TaxID=2320859 RepID=A0A418WTY8_9PROT|nr:alpha/beta hydrolase [Oleomonas cavernae]RJF94721.1 alpha/beta hydrolase [Oleomonas cavernae]